MDWSDYGYEQHLSDWYDENNALATWFGRFFEVFALVSADVDAVLIDDYCVADDRLDAFGKEVLDELGFSHKVGIMRRALDRCGVPGARKLARDLRRAAAFRNRLVHDLMEWRAEPGRGSPSLRHRAPYGPASDEQVIDAQGLEERVDELLTLAKTLRAAASQVHQRRNAG